MKVKISIEDLRSQHTILQNMNSGMFTGEGIDFSEFTKQFIDYQRDMSVISNYFCAQIIVNGIKKYANELFWETYESFWKH